VSETTSSKLVSCYSCVVVVVVVVVVVQYVSNKVKKYSYAYD